MVKAHPKGVLTKKKRDPGCPCLEEENDDDFNRRPRCRKKKSHKMERPLLPPDDPDSITPLPIYQKWLRLIQKEY